MPCAIFHWPAAMFECFPKGLCALQHGVLCFECVCMHTRVLLLTYTYMHVVQEDLCCFTSAPAPFERMFFQLMPTDSFTSQLSPFHIIFFIVQIFFLFHLHQYFSLKNVLVEVDLDWIYVDNNSNAILNIYIITEFLRFLHFEMKIRNLEIEHNLCHCDN